jgi:hypothetical protein
MLSASNGRIEIRSHLNRVEILDRIQLGAWSAEKHGMQPSALR